jgi:hypothetical protein
VAEALVSDLSESLEAAKSGHAAGKSGWNSHDFGLVCVKNRHEGGRNEKK